MRVKGTFQELTDRDDVEQIYLVRYSDVQGCDMPTEIWDYSHDRSTFDTSSGTFSVSEVEADPEAYFMAECSSTPTSSKDAKDRTVVESSDRSVDEMALMSSVMIEGLGEVLLEVGGDLEQVGVDEFGAPIILSNASVFAYLKDGRVFRHFFIWHPSRHNDHEDGYDVPVTANTNNAAKLFLRVLSAAKSGEWKGPVDNPHWELVRVAYGSEAYVKLESEKKGLVNCSLKPT